MKLTLFCQEVTTSLDAGVKIYSCRVDNVHADTMKMATSMNTVSHKNKYLDDIDDEEGQGDAEKSLKKTRRKVHIVLSPRCFELHVS